LRGFRIMYTRITIRSLVETLFYKINDKSGLEKNKDNVVSESIDPQFFPGFTPDGGQKNVDEVKSARDSQPKEDLIGTNVVVASVTSGIKGFTTLKLGGSLLDVIDELIKVGLVDLPLEGYSYTWSHKSASKMSKLDRYWKIIDDDVVAAVLQFFSSCTFPPRCNSSFTALIPKTKEAKVVKDFRPISLIGRNSYQRFFDIISLFYVDDVVFVSKWDKMNVATIVNVHTCFFLASGLKINLQKSKLMGIGILHQDVLSAAESIGCFILTVPFNFIGVKVGDIMSRHSSWEETI
nr:RNA-directed DNA polymerase, eukaryota [Tanacetum cinerariifolium]